jgi:hypothetical protein
VNAPPPSNWTNTVIKAAWSLVFVAVAAYIVWWLLEPLLPLLVILLVLIGILRLAVGWFRRDGW